uniref:DEAD-box ATP-dependent RNA helicase 7 isoform X2 n=1 Tax=Rhizophora mucronata TaxID=61149 RepID=A0A2P2MMK0_RHIMU
MLNLFLEK